MEAPLADVRVLDLSRVAAGPYCTMLLADLGADVVKVERPGGGDETRGWAPPEAGGESAYYLALNRNKRSLAVDLKQEAGRALTLELCSRADVVIENFRPGTAHALGLGYEHVRAVNAGVVYCSITGFGSARQPADRPGYDFVAQAESGLMHITGPAAGEPSKVGVAVVDLLTGLHAAVAVLAALTRRGRSGEGERIEVSLIDSALAALINVASNALVTGREPSRYGNGHPNIVPYQTFAAADGGIAVAAANDGLFRRLCAVVEAPHLAEDPRFVTNEARVRHRDELLPVLAEHFASRAADEWVAALSEAGIPAGRIRRVREAFQAVADAGLPATVRVPHPTAGEVELVKPPFRLDSEPDPSVEAPPLLGEHTVAVLREAGHSPQRIEALEREGVVAQSQVTRSASPPPSPAGGLGGCRSRFPALTARGAPVFLDNPGGTQVPREVAEAMSRYLLTSNANAHGAFATSERTDAAIADAHSAMADLLGASPEEVAFGPNMTSLTFALSRALGRELREGDEILLTTLDHDANIAPWLMLAEDRGLTVRFADVNEEDCTLDTAGFERALGNRTRVAAFTYASNAVGTVNDVHHLTRLAHDAGALVFIDAVQYAAHGAIDVRDIGCDFLACSPYKFFGPHAGALYARRDHSERLRAYKVRPADDAPPWKWETGTQSHEAMAGTTAAIDYIASLAPGGGSRRERLVTAFAAVEDYERDLSRLLLEGLAELPVTVHGIADPDRIGARVPTFALTAPGHAPRELARSLAERGFNLWDGNYYALALMERLGLERGGGALRVGAVHYNTPAEIERFVAELEAVLEGGGAAPASEGESSADHTSQG